MGKHIVSLSGGVSSAIAADRVIARHGRNTILWFADTSWEDDDLYRFLDDLERHWGLPITKHKDGRNPLEVAEAVKLIPNQKRAPCTRVLKIEPFVKFITALDKPLTVHLGLDWHEQHRMARPKAAYEAIEGVRVEFPLMWEPMVSGNYFDVVESWGISPPRLYRYGFPHNNCGGRCIRQGVKEWRRLLAVFPDRFAEVRDWETIQRQHDDARANYAICRDQSGGMVRPKTLSDVETLGGISEAAAQEDAFGCFCSY